MIRAFDSTGTGVTGPGSVHTLSKAIRVIGAVMEDVTKSPVDTSKRKVPWTRSTRSVSPKVGDNKSVYSTYKVVKA
jgi:hypothetical protein